MNSLALQLAEWTSGLQTANIPAKVREAAVRAFIDTIGVLLAGATDDIATVMRTWVAKRPRDDGAIVPPYGLATDPETAALALGVLAHALDFDDIHPAMLGHPSGVLIPVILSLGSMAHLDGNRAIAAYVAGAELAAHLGRAAAPPPSAYWQPRPPRHASSIWTRRPPRMRWGLQPRPPPAYERILAPMPSRSMQDKRLRMA
jgi:2-methylcitrate dehydratase PrpD